MMPLLFSASFTAPCVGLTNKKSPRPNSTGAFFNGDPQYQTWKLSPQPQRPFSFGFLKTKPVWNLSST